MTPASRFLHAPARWLPLGLALVAITLATAFTLRGALPTNTVTLPIEVYPADGTSEHVESVTLHVSDASGIDSLYVQAHQPFYIIGGWERGVADDGFDPEQAAAIRINGGDWVPVRDENVNCAWPERAYDCVAGPYHTIRFTIPATDAQSGANTIDFKFNGTEGVRSGYRVIGLGLMTGADPSVQDFDPMQHGAHDGTTFQEDDYSAWAPPAGYDNATDISEGEQLWNEEGILDELDGSSIQASCGSCHARDGRDLKYFNYSNRTIIARSQGHGLSPEQGKQIAAYIRSVELRKEDGSSYVAPGRPWNPPYQPGPRGFGPNGTQGPDEADQVYWAAGAGLEWVLDAEREVPNTERDMLAHLFPKNGNPANGVDWLANGQLNWHHVSTDSTHNPRSVPQTAQFPDWNNWLPRIHPMDAAPSTFNGSLAENWYEGRPTEGATIDEIENWINNPEFRESGLNSLPNEQNYSSNKFAQARFSAYAWLLVKFWETLHGLQAEDGGKRAYCADGSGHFCEPLGWPGRIRMPFDLAPHINAPSGQKSSPWVYANESQDKIFSHLWYHLQLIINPGSDPRSSGQTPVDWGYQRAHTTEIEKMYGVGAGLRMFQSEIMQLQIFGQGGLGCCSGWTMYTGPNRRMKDALGSSDIFQNLPTDLSHKLLTAFTRSWLERELSYDISELPRDRFNNRTWETQDYVPPTDGYEYLNNHTHRLYTMLIDAADLGAMPASLIDSVGVRYQALHPNTGSEPPTHDCCQGPAWDEIANIEAPSVSIIAPTDGNTFTAPASLTIQLKASSSASSVEQVGLRVNGSPHSSRSIGPYEFTLTNLPDGTYTLEGTATAADGEVGASDPITVTVEAGGEVGSTGSQTIDLQPGWNLISSRFAPEETAIDQLLSDVSSSVEVVEGEDGYVYKPGEGVNTLGHWNPLEGIMVYSDTEQQLTISGQALRPAWTPLALESGWNLVPYLPNTTLPIEEAFQSISDDLVLIKDAAGNAYVPTYGVDEIGSLQPGQGYKVFVSGPATLTYPASESLNVQQAAQTDPVSSARQK